MSMTICIYGQLPTVRHNATYVAAAAQHEQLPFTGETGAAWERRVSASHDSAGADIAAPPRKTLDLAARHSPSDGWADVDGRDQSSQRNERNERNE